MPVVEWTEMVFRPGAFKRRPGDKGPSSYSDDLRGRPESLLGRRRHGVRGGLKQGLFAGPIGNGLPRSGARRGDLDVGRLKL